ncbi:MAG: glycosyltransferase family 4 protein [Chitinophagales bacterium]
MNKVLILGPDLRQPGGVAAIYKTLQLEKTEGINYFAVNRPRPQSGIGTLLRLIGKYWKFIVEVRRGHYKLIHINPSLQRKSFYRDAGFIIIARLLKRKTLVFFHGWRDVYEKKIVASKLKSYLFRISYAKVDKFIVLSKIFKEKLIGLGVPATKEFFIGSSVADSSHLNELDLNQKFCSYAKQVNFLFLSRIEKEKGIYIAIDAFALFSKNHPEKKACLVVAGDGSELVLVKEYVKNGNITGVNFLGNVSGEAKKKVLFESHVMIFPSYTEGLPNCILEGMLYGMPIISRMTGGIPDVIEQGVNGYLSESLRPEVFADFLFFLASDKNLYETISLNNHNIAVKKYTTEKVREHILKIYEEVN